MRRPGGYFAYGKARVADLVPVIKKGEENSIANIKKTKETTRQGKLSDKKRFPRVLGAPVCHF